MDVELIEEKSKKGISSSFISFFLPSDDQR